MLDVSTVSKREKPHTPHTTGDKNEQGILFLALML